MTLKQKLEAYIKARDEATPGDYDTRCNELSNYALPVWVWSDPYGFVARCDTLPKQYSVPTAEFIVKAANESRHYAELLLKALEIIHFYAEPSNWKSVTIEDTHRRFCIFTGSDLEYFQDDNQNSFCGRKARDFLKRLEDSK